ncbi:MAG: dihydroneopterin aldolase [Holosporaceae bacterium]|jgi:dihydroneopterin aldolase|nr:dihydroneopterin aldolase [Holosporaceae bacterium]
MHKKKPSIRQLDITNYETEMILGYCDFEKLKKRKVSVSVSLRFSEKNDACGSDDLDDTVCYAELTNFIDKTLGNSEFCLIERTAGFLYDRISEYLKDETILKYVKITKINPPIKNLESASFICSDW